MNLIGRSPVAARDELGLSQVTDLAVGTSISDIIDKLRRASVE
jgi:hypothetical protein